MNCLQRIILWCFLSLGAAGATLGQEVDSAGHVSDAIAYGAVPPQVTASHVSVADQPRIQIQWGSLPPAATQTLASLNVKSADLRDVLRAIAAQHDLNLVVDDRIDQLVTVRLSNLPVVDALIFLCKEYRLDLVQSGQIFRVELSEAALPAPRVPIIALRDSLLSVDLEGDDLQVVMRDLAEKSRRNIVVRQGVTGTLTGFLQEVPFEAALQTLLHNNGYTLRTRNEIYVVDQVGAAGNEAAAIGSSPWVHVEEGRVKLDLADADVMAVLQELTAQLGLDLVTYGFIEGRVSARLSSLSADEALDYLFKGTSFSYRRQGNVIIVGDKQLGGIATTKLIRLKHLRSEGLVERLPAYLREHATFQVIKEHNGLVVVGANDIIMETERFIEQIDTPTPQILIEALVVDFEQTDLLQLGLTVAGGGGGPPPAGVFEFGGGTEQQGGLVVEGGARLASNALKFWGDLLSLGSIGRLPADFYFQLQALEREGKANVRSRPQIATLNGHTASISVGTTQYYILKTLVPFPTGGTSTINETERFERVDANVSLEITPWVSASGEVTAEIHPEFATPVGVLDPRVPPTINNRVVNTTVRLKDGETVIIGGLIQESQVAVHNKVPVLGSIPLLGRLFRNQRIDTRKSELVIFITPHVFYGDERDEAKWKGLKEKVDPPSRPPAAWNGDR